MQPLRLCMFLASIAVLNASGASKKVLDFLSIYNGDFDNELQTKESGDDHDFMQTPVVFIEVYFNKTIGFRVMAEVKDGIEDTVSLTMYNLTGNNKYKPGEYNVDNLSNISCGDLHREDCIASYRVVSEGYVFGNLQECGVTVNGQHPRYTCDHECASFASSLALYIQQRSPMEPYELQLIGLKYPLINPPKDYVSPCGN